MLKRILINREPITAGRDFTYLFLMLMLAVIIGIGAASLVNEHPLERFLNYIVFALPVSAITAAVTLSTIYIQRKRKRHS